MLSKWSLLVVVTTLISVPVLQAQQTSTETAAPAASQDAAASKPAVNPQPPVPLTQEQRADIYMARKMYREAIEQYKECTSTASVLNKIGIAYHQLGDLGAAKKHYKRAIKMNRQFSEAYNNLGTVYYAERNYRRAIKEYKKALKIMPHSASMYCNLGTAYFARKKYDDASDAYRQAILLDPGVFEHRASYGVLMQNTNVEERAQFHYYLAKAYAQAGITDKAIQFIRKALEEGFKDREKFTKEPEFKSLQELAEFKELMVSEPRVL
jgi:tetratricopeptide (TPR) repeat protein